MLSTKNKMKKEREDKHTISRYKQSLSWSEYLIMKWLNTVWASNWLDNSNFTEFHAFRYFIHLSQSWQIRCFSVPFPKIKNKRKNNNLIVYFGLMILTAAYKSSKGESSNKKHKCISRRWNHYHHTANKWLHKLHCSNQCNLN